ncbi:MAG: hypothetical protein PHE48_02680 [Candidatus Daviesbacteria bacterium]|nr:hypothetical protein [Candidatus Daviesbacteria bacterium]
MFYFITFLFELILLFFLSRKLINSLVKLIYKLTRSHRVVVHILALIFLPGTIIHELAHLLFAGVVLVPVGEMNVLPEIEEKGVKLGSVQIGYTDPLRRMIVGVAPVLLGMILIFSIFLLVKIGTSPWWQVILAIYLLFEIGNTMFSSRKDIEGSILFVILILAVAAAILVVLYFLNPALIQKIWLWSNGLNLEGASNFFETASIYLIVPVVLDFSAIFLTKPFAGRS